MKRTRDGSPKKIGKKEPRLGGGSLRPRARLLVTAAVAVFLVVGCLVLNQVLPAAERMTVGQIERPGGARQSEQSAAPESKDPAPNPAAPEAPALSGGFDPADPLGGAMAGSTDEYFANYRLEREKTRSQQVELLQELIDDESADAEARSQAEAQIERISEQLEQELVLEGILEGKYGGKVVVFIQDSRANVIISPGEKKLDELEVEKIAELADQYTSVGYENTVVILR